MPKNSRGRAQDPLQLNEHGFKPPTAVILNKNMGVCIDNGVHDRQLPEIKL